MEDVTFKPVINETPKLGKLAQNVLKGMIIPIIVRIQSRYAS